MLIKLEDAWIATAPTGPLNDGGMRHCELSEAIHEVGTFKYEKPSCIISLLPKVYKVLLERKKAK